MEEVDVKMSLDWCGYPRRSAYWWDHKRTRPRIPSPPSNEELMKAWEAVRGTVDVSKDESKPDAR